MLLLVTDEAAFLTLVPFLILAATALFAFGERIRLWLTGAVDDVSASGALYLVLFLSSIYGGYFGAGLGIILLAIVQIMGFKSFFIANSIKNLLATSFTVLSIAVFGVGG